jgi:putative colanic acid biosynthesis acetyltransferase WcaF
MHSVQDLARFSLPPGFRGRSVLLVQFWWIVQALFVHATPQAMYGWRRWVIRLFGAKIGREVLIRPSVRITYPWKVTIGDRAWIGDGVELYSVAEIVIGHDAVISQGSYLCTGSHDHRDPSFPVFARSIVVEPEAWIAAQCLVGPGVRIGRGAVIGLRSLVLADVPAYAVAFGHPAAIVGDRPGKCQQ